ncbi:MAG: 4Fe-4S binding protein [Candidatus Sumerlaeota bacterium]
MADRYQKFYRSFIETIVLIVIGALVGWFCGPALSKLHPVIQEAEKVYQYEKANGDVVPFEVEAFRIEGVPRDMLFHDAREIREKFRWGGASYGVWAGLVIGFSLGSVRLDHMASDYEADPALCVSCGRCYMSCPVEHRRLGLLGEIKAAKIQQDIEEDEKA